ncbi:hypothetical protein ACFSYD_15415 [Paracoccus aerius]
MRELLLGQHRHAAGVAKGAADFAFQFDQITRLGPAGSMGKVFPPLQISKGRMILAPDHRLLALCITPHNNADHSDTPNGCRWHHVNLIKHNCTLCAW